MRQISLTEYQCSSGVALNSVERKAIQRCAPQISIQPTVSTDGCFDLTPGSYIGAINTGETLIEIRPKIPVDRLLFLISYSVDPRAWKDLYFYFRRAESVVEALVPTFTRMVSRATNRGLLHGYRPEDCFSQTVRGQIRFADQVRDHFGLAPPIEIQYDEFTEDIDENRILRAALHRLRRLPIRSTNTVRALNEVEAAFRSVSLLEYSGHSIPEIRFTRLNSHYCAAVTLAQLILRSSSFDLAFGAVRGSAFLLDMNEVFERFVHRALQESLGLSDLSFPRGRNALRLDRAKQIHLVPDLSWWESGHCRFVGDLKYKQIDAKGIKHPDLYQLLAYTVAADLPSGLLIYATGEAKPCEHVVVHVGKTLVVTSINLEGSPQSLLREIDRIAALVKNMPCGDNPG
jgi:5-methylcytosine-specific restriction enzyme subunit McrC